LLEPLRKGRFDLVGNAFKRSDADRPLLAGLEEARNQLLPLEAFARAVFLDHHVRDLVDPLVAGESATAVEAFAAAANHLALLALARVDDFIAQMCAERAFHRLPPSPPVVRRPPARSGPPRS